MNMNSSNDNTEDVVLVKLKHLNFEELAEEECKPGGIGFWITDYRAIDKQKGAKAPNGIYSPEYGSTWGDDGAFMDRYKCKCGTLRGTLLEGVTCTECNTPVTFKDDDLSVTGWFKLNHRVIHPIMYKRLLSVIGKELVEILTPPKCDYNGDYVYANNPQKPYLNIGMIEFQNRFDEILEFYMTKKHRWKDKLEEYDLIMENRDLVFTSCLPVYSLILRPVTIIGGTVQYTKVNKDFTRLSTIVSHINKIKDAGSNMSALLKLLDVAQSYYMSIYKHAVEYIAKTKRSHIRAQMLGSRYNFTSRTVIIPFNDRCRVNHIKLPYLCFLELFKPEIINALTALGKPIAEAKNIWFEASMKFVPMVYEIMMSMVRNKEKPVKVLINRNPSYCIGPHSRERVLKIALIAGRP